MLTRRRLLSNTASLLAASLYPLSLVGCRQQDSIQVGIHTWIGYESLYLSSAFGWLPEGCHLVDNRNASESLGMLVNGQVQVACLTLDEVIQARDQGVSVEVALVFNVSAGADMVISRTAFASLSQLKGLRIGYEPGALGALMLHELLQKAALTHQDVQLIDVPPDQQLEYWKNDSVDVLITYEPTASLLLADGGVKVFDSRQIPEKIFDVLAVRSDLLSYQSHKLLAGITTTHFRALEYIRRQRQDALYRIANRQEIDYEQVQLALGGIHLPTLTRNRLYLSGKDRRLLDAAYEVESIMLSARIIGKKNIQDDLCTERWLPALEAQV